MKKISTWQVKGMNKDMSVSKFSPEFAFENMNLRLSTNEGNTLMSWVNEKGPLAITHDTITGIAIGTAVLNSTLVLFTTLNTSETHPASKIDYIYKIEYNNDVKTSMSVTLLYTGNLNFYTGNPLETLVSYEAEHIKKVYWVDGRNQPRLINIAVDNLDKPNTGFDFVPTIDMSTTAVTITKNVSGGGLFAPGVLQYCFSYINKYGQQTNLVWVSSLEYLCYSDRGASPEESVTCSFKIVIDDVDTSFDYVRLYSVQRTSLDDTPIVKLLDDLPINGDSSLLYVDNGTSGSAMDPTELLYVGGKEIIAGTMIDKDATLFLGNITQKDSSVDKVQKWFDDNRADFSEVNFSIGFVRDDDGGRSDTYKTVTLNHTDGIYSNTNMLNKGTLRDISTFKGGETYRLGFQLQKKTGEWSDPIFIDDVTNDKYPGAYAYMDDVTLPYAESTIDLSYFIGSGDYHIDNFKDVYKKIRPIVVYPNIGDRSVLCQGVLNPTVFNTMDRIDNSPFAQSSWYFRPYMASVNLNSANVPIDLSTKVTITKSPSTPAPTPISEIKSVYVLTLTMTNADVSAALDRKTIRMHYTDYTINNGVTVSSHDEYEEYAFDGAIYLSDVGNNKRYAFFSTSKWREEETHTEGSPDNWQYVWHWEREYADAASVDYIAYEDSQAVSIYKDIKSANGLYYYYNSDGSAPAYVFDFNSSETSGGTVYVFEASFAPVDTDYTTGYNSSGTGIKFKHYDYLYAASSVPSNTSTAVEDAKNIEIQGSVNIPSSVYSTYKKLITSTNSNTTFGIDQSIVTLHSPEIEFDTEVQKYGNEGLKLRIIGVVPITAGVSAHSIKTSSGMVEINHNNDAGDYAYFGTGESSYNVVHRNIDLYAGNRLVSEYLWNDTLIIKDVDEEDGIKTKGLYNFLVYPWQRESSLNNDSRSSDEASSLLKTKKESNLLYSINSEYGVKTSSQETVAFEHLSSQIHLTENSQVLNIRLPKQKSTSSEINYYPNIDKVLYNADGYKILTKEDTSSDPDITASDLRVSNPISMKYKSTSHAVIAFNATPSVGMIPILPYAKMPSNTYIGKFTNPSGNTTAFWGDKGMTFTQEGIDLTSNFDSKLHNFLWLGELYKDVDASSRFGGRNKNALLSNSWRIAGDEMIIPASGDTVTLRWTEGDTYYQRYDCLKTYAFTQEDTNQIVEILSFMCESHINLDGRYDKNRGQVDNTNMRPEIFNLLNPAYSQENNFFSYRRVEHDEAEKGSYPNVITYSKTKTSGADVDLWTNVTLGSTLELDGDKGNLNKLTKFSDQIIGFQDTGIARILYNENAAISTSAGVPIELANSGKVDGKRYISDTVGCSNKHSIVTTPNGIYFMDSHGKNIYLFNGQLQNLSVAGGMNTWTKNNVPGPEISWDPVNFGNFRSFYDKLNQDVLFVNNSTALAWSEKLVSFTSFYNYEGTPYFENLDNTGIWIRRDSTNTKLYRQNAGTYCNFFGTQKPYWMTLIGNPEPTADKIFTNLEMASNIAGEGTESSGKLTPFLPFSHLETWNEYQHGIATLNNLTGSAAMKHFNGLASSLKRKFRLWRCDIPRDNAAVDSSVAAPFSTDSTLGIKRFRTHSNDRMRNPWLYLKLYQEPSNSARKTEIHDVIMTYFD